MNEERNKAIARIIAGTRKKKRVSSIVHIALDIQQSIQELGSLSAVAQEVGVSAGMLNQFLSVFRVIPEIRALAESKEIDEVSTIFYLSKFNDSEQRDLTPLVLNGQIKGQDLRALLPYRRVHQTGSILRLLEKLKTTQNIKASVIKVPKDSKSKSVLQITERLNSVIDPKDLIAINETATILEIKLTKRGEEKIRAYCKSVRLSLSSFITDLAYEKL